MSGTVVQARCYQGQLATMAVESIIDCLIQAKRLPHGYSLGKPQCHVPANLCRLIGREQELQQVAAAFQKDARCVVIQGGPGEGKSALAQAAVRHLWEQAKLPGGAYVVNLAGDTRCLPTSMPGMFLPSDVGRARGLSSCQCGAGCVKANQPSKQESGYQRSVLDIIGDLLASSLLRHQVCVCC